MRHNKKVKSPRESLPSEPREFWKAVLTDIVESTIDNADHKELAKGMHKLLTVPGATLIFTAKAHDEQDVCISTGELVVWEPGEQRELLLPAVATD